MRIVDMHHDFKMKLNKVNSQQYRGLLPQEIDWFLNEAQMFFIKMVAFPRQLSFFGFEKTKRNAEDLHTLNKTKHKRGLDPKKPLKVIPYPNDYLYYVSIDVTARTEECDVFKTIRATIQQQDDVVKDNPFYDTSYGWEQVNLYQVANGFEILYSDYEDLLIYGYTLRYLKKPKYMHAASVLVDPDKKYYELPSGEKLEDIQECELPEHVHRDIVDIAVMIASGAIETQGYQIHSQKVNMNNT